jgi:hypothetical protein
VPTFDLLSKVSKLKYYPSEVFPQSFLNLYGNWKYINTTGGLAGAILPPSFDVLEIKSFGIYGIVKNNLLVEYGRIDIVSVDQLNSILTIKLVPDFRLDAAYTSVSNQLISVSNDILHLSDTAANGFVTAFSKV